MSLMGHFAALPLCSIAVRFTPVSGIDSRSQVLPGRANSRPEQVQQSMQLFDHLVGESQQLVWHGQAKRLRRVEIDS
jgi:hypothetical protein